MYSTSLTRVVEKVASVWFRDQPVHRGENVSAVREKRATWVRVPIITHDYLRPWVVRVALVAEELHHVRDILLAASKCMLRADIVDPNKKRLAAQLLWRMLLRVLRMCGWTTDVL